MQEWIIAMLVISVLLILRDMAKTILTGRMSKKEEIFPIGEDHPQKEKVERYAAAFQKLADTFYGMPYNAYGHFPRPSGPRSPARQGHIKRPVLRLAEPSFLRPANQCC